MRDGIDRFEISVFLTTTWKNGRPAVGPHLLVAVELLLLFPPLDKFTIHRLNRLFYFDRLSNKFSRQITPSV